MTFYFIETVEGRGAYEVLEEGEAAKNVLFG